jgi:hypothetical protein
VKPLKPSDIGLKSAGFAVPDDYIEHRIIANVEALEKFGKSHWCMHAQSPIVIHNFDRGTDGVVQKAMKDGKQIIVAGMPLTDEDRARHRLPSYSFHKPTLKPGQSTKDTSYVTSVADRARACWKKFREDYEEALQSEARTVVVDTGTGAYELARYAAFGKLTQVMPLEYARVNGEFQGLIHRGYDSDKNILWIHRLKPEWAEERDAKGNLKSGKTGRLERAGYRDMGFEVQMNLRLAKERDKKGKFHYTTTVLDCRLNSEIDGLVLRDGMSNFQFLAASVFENDPEEWE